MQKMVVCGVLGLVVACGGGQKPAQDPGKPVISNTVKADPAPAAQPASGYGEALVAMQRFRDQFCACADANCATHVSDDMTKWAQTMTSKWGDDQPKPTEEQTKQLQEIGEQMAKCMSKAMAAGGPPGGGGSNPCGGP